MSSRARPEDDSQLIEWLGERDQQLADGQVPGNGRQKESASSPPPGIKLETVKKCLEKLQNFARRNSFPGEPQLPDNIGRFRIQRQLGVGGFGIVLLAHDPKLNRQVALKILRPECLVTWANRVRFERESQLAAMLNHPAIVPVFETGIDGPIRYIVFGYVPGENLADWFNRFGQPLDPLDATDALIRIADAVACAHNRGILHRDLKPGNLLVQSDGPAESVAPEALADRIHVADFGLAIDLEQSSSLTRSGTMVGTPVYIAPELISGLDKPSTASDVYSLGVVLYELLAGRPPFESDSGMQLLRIIVEEVPPRINNIRGSSAAGKSGQRSGLPPVPRDLEAISFKCLHKNPALRYQSARELHRDLLRFKAGESVLARPVTAWSQIVRWAVRKPAIALLLSAVGLLVLTLALGGSWAALKLTQQNSILKDSWFESLVSRSQLTRQSARAGRRTDSLAAIESAVQMLSVEATDPRRLTLRNEAIASMGLVDMQIISRIPWPECVKQAPTGFEIAFDSAVQHVAVSNTDGDAVILNTVTGETIKTISAEGGHIRHLKFVPGADKLCGVLQFTGKADLVVWPWSNDAPFFKHVLKIKNIVPEFRIDCSADGKFIVALDADGQVRLIDLVTGDVQNNVGKYDGQFPAGATFSPSGGRVAVWHGNQVDVWNVNGDDLANEPELQFDHKFNPNLVINSVTWSPNEERLATTTSVFTTHLWSTVWGDSKHQELPGHTSWVFHAVFDHEGKFIATSSSDNTTRLWNHESAELVLVDQGRVTAINQDRSRLAGFDADSILVWEMLEPGFQTEWAWDGNCNACQLAADTGHSNADGQYLAYSNVSHLAIREIRTQRDVWKADIACGGEIRFFGNPKAALVSKTDRLVRVDLNSGDEQLIAVYGDSDVGCGIADDSFSVSHDGSIAAISLSTGQAFVDCGTGQLTPAEFQFSDLGYIRFHPTQPQFAVATDRGIEIRDYETNQRVEQFENSALSHPIKFDRDGRFLVLHHDGRPALLNLDSGGLELISQAPVKLRCDDVAFSPDRQWLAVCGTGQAILLFELNSNSSQSGNSLEIATEAARFPVSTAQTWVAFDATSTQLISADPDHLVYHLDLPAIRRRLAAMGLDW